MVLLAAILVCVAGIAYGVIQFGFPDIHEEILRLGRGPRWLERRYDPYSSNVRQIGWVWIAIFGGHLIWLVVRALRHYGIVSH